ncbi:unnamed protein product [Lactuca virosa]|uniref:MBD domain-containing protein n=1 Tax=Lactuca virosa TaxID=75947 RepID=A0AAU9NZC7_9ASTR|nr:unnamed protein product [Lactuca virosa]
MAATVATAEADDTERPAIRLDSVPVVDLRLLTQSELYTLSISSDSSFDPNRCDEVVIPKINRAVFNESAGSRKQTYSRLRLASAESSSTTTKTTTLHRRTPHLRASHAHPSNNINDPEQAENSQIIRMLKQLCKSDPNFQDVDQMEAENNSNSVVPEFLSTENLGIKRKRGRPRKHENVVFLRPPTAKRIRHNTVKKVVVYDNEMDREIVNDSGVPVNMATLAGLDDPYGPEIRRRTMGMSTEDDLLGFLRGMNGQWGSRRRKRRVVDAREFGDVLPKGWKLSLCIKKKEGRVWLFCRRYLSPSGRQFESCREISAYLNSVVKQENSEKQNHVNINTSDNFALEGASVNAVDLVIQQDIKTDDPVDNPSSSSSPPTPPAAAPPVPTKCEEQVTIDEMEVEAHDTKRSELVTPVNEHIECNVENEREKVEPSLPPATELDSDPNLMTDAPNNKSLATVSSGDNVVVETHDAHSNDNVEPASHDLNIMSPSKQDGNSNVDRGVCIEESCHKSGEKSITNDEVSQTDQDPDVSVSQSELLGDETETPLSINENTRNTETLGESHVNSVDNKLDSNLDQGINSESFMLSSFPNELVGNQDSVSDQPINQDSVSINQNSVSDQEINQDPVSETGVTFVDSIPDQSDSIPEQMGSKDHVGTTASIELPNPAVKTIEENSFGAKMDIDIDIKADEVATEKEKSVGESSSVFFLGRFGLDKDGATVVKKLSTKTNRVPVKIVNSETLISPQKQDSPSVHNLAPDTFNNVNKLSSGLSSSGLDGQFDFRTNDFGSFGPSLSPWQEEECENKNLGNDISFPNMEEPQIPSNKQEEDKLDDFQTFRNNEAKGNESVTSLGSNLEFCSLIPSENDQEFGFQDCLYERAMEECKQEESSERGLLDHFSIADTSDDIFENKMYSTSLGGLKFDEDRDISSNELSLAFGNPHELYPDSLRVEQKKDLVAPSKMDETFGVHTNLSMVNNSMVDDLKGGRGLFNLGCNDKSSSFQNQGNTVYPGRAWEDLKNSGNKFSSGFGSQSHAEVVPGGGMWKSGDGNQNQQMRSGLSNSSSHAQIPYPSSFHSFNIMSEKAGDGEFRVDESFLTAGRSQHNPHAHALEGRDSRGAYPIPYNVNVNVEMPMEQQFDSSSFWLGKNTTMNMMPNTNTSGSGRNHQQITSHVRTCQHVIELFFSLPQQRKG